MTDVLHSIGLDHVEFYVTDAAAATDELVRKYGFEIAGESLSDSSTHRSIALRQNGILIVLTQALCDEHPARRYVMAHGDGLANIAFRVPDVSAAFDAAVAAGARPLGAPAETDGALVAAIDTFGDVQHTFVQGPARARADLPPGLVPAERSADSGRLGLRAIDHIAVLVNAGQLDETVEFYRSVLGFRRIFEERFTVGSQGMNSKVVQNAATDVTFTIIEPDLDYQPGQIDEFVKNNDGAGVQHLAFSTENIVEAVETLEENGVDFLETPDAYYELLPKRIDLVKHTVAELRELNILADADHAGQLFQVFTRTTHPRRTFFIEIIERLGAKTFGNGNVRALYEAVELDRAKAAADA